VYFYPITYSNHGDLDKIFKMTVDYLLDSRENILKILSQIDIIIEDGAKISKIVYSLINKASEFTLKETLLSIEQTTEGIRFFENIPINESLYPVIDNARSSMKLNVENKIATPESILSYYITSRQTTLVRKKVLIIGYGYVGSGLSNLCKAHGAAVVIYDSDPIKRALAYSNGFKIVDDKNFEQCLPTIDIIFSCTANHTGDTINENNIFLMKNEVEIINTGSGTGEISPNLLKEGKIYINQGVIDIGKLEDHFTCAIEKNNDKKFINLLYGGYPINLRGGHGTATEAIEIVFSCMLLSAIQYKEYLNVGKKGIIALNESVEKEIAQFWYLNNDQNHDSEPELFEPVKASMSDRPYGGVIKFGRKENALNNFSVARAVFFPNKTTLGHYHKISEEGYIFEKGRAKIYMWHVDFPHIKKSFDCKAGDYLTIPPLYVHQIKTMSEGCVCLVIAAPSFSFWDQFFPDEIRQNENDS
jgi:S-adenosylhomocysteine hydrolase/mannose-6-phosphate isomerase-like protein (cupin superfamily)